MLTLRSLGSRGHPAGVSARLGVAAWRGYSRTVERATGTDLDGIVEAIMRRFADRQRVVPAYVVRDAVTAALGRLYPQEQLATLQVPADVVADLIDAFSDEGRPSGEAAMPAVLSGDEAGRLITGLGLAVHIAAFNLDRDRLHVTHVLNGAAAVLVALGGASRAAHADGTAAVLLSPDTLHTARTTIIGLLQGVDQRGWRVDHLDERTTTALIGGILQVLGGAA